MKNKFIKSTLILIIGGAITKMINMLIRIILARILGTDGIGIYMLLMPTFSLFIAIAQLGFPVAISKLVAEENRKSKNLVFSIVPISLLINFIIMIILIFSSNYIANNLLHEPNTYYGLICMSLVLPFISISSILRGYFFGKQRMFPHVISNITEDIVRLITIILGLPIFLLKGIDYAISFVILSNIISELTSILILFIFLPKNFKIEKKDIVPDRTNLKDIFSISIPTTISRLIGNIGYFFEPIIITNVLLHLGYQNSYIIHEYGIINGYSLSLLTLPSFFIMAISGAIIPVISKSYSKGDLMGTKRKIKQGIIFSLIIGIPISLFFFIYPELPLKLIYNTNEGINYIRILSLFFILSYISAPLSSSLQAMGKSNISMRGTIIGMLIKIIVLIVGLYLIGIWGLILSLIIGIIFSTIYNLYHINKLINKKRLI